MSKELSEKEKIMSIKNIPKKLGKNEWWNPTPLFATIYRIFLIIGGRGVGKTFGLTKHVLDDLFFNGVAMVYLRRLGVEIDDLEKGSFITEKMLRLAYGSRLQEFEFDDKKGEMRFSIDNDIHTLKTYGNHLYFDGRVIVYFIALSRAGRVKSNNYPDVKYMVYDEVLIDKKIIPNARYIRNEFTVLLNFIETVKRERTDFYLFMLSNVGQNFNPIFAGLNYYLTHDDIKKGVIEKDNFLIQLVENREEKIDMSDPFNRLAATSKDFMLSKTNAFENIRVPYFKETRQKPDFVVKYERQYLGVATYRLPRSTDLYYQVYQDIEDLPEDIKIYNPDFDTLEAGETFLTDIFKKQHLKNYFEIFQKNMCYHQTPETYLAWSRMVFDLN